jgi:hypothetical protein
MRHHVNLIGGPGMAAGWNSTPRHSRAVRAFLSAGRKQTER